MMLNRASIRAAASFCALLLTTTAAEAMPERICQATKNKAAGKYTACRHNAEAKVATSGDMARYGSALLKCETKLTAAWNRASAKAIAVGATCLDDPLTVSDFETVIAAHTDNVATALSGGGLSNCPTDLATCQAEPKGKVLKTGQTTCFGPGGAVVGCAGTGQDGEFQKGLSRSYTDNGDGTITDNRTGLMWEKLSDDGTIHDKDDLYTWADTFAVKLATLNNGSGFASYTDWRLPNLYELLSIVDYQNVNPAVGSAFNSGCLPSCSVTTCSCTEANDHWTSTAVQDAPSSKWRIYFHNGFVFPYPEGSMGYVRAVRGGS